MDAVEPSESKQSNVSPIDDKAALDLIMSRLTKQIAERSSALFMTISMLKSFFAAYLPKYLNKVEGDVKDGDPQSILVISEEEMLITYDQLNMVLTIFMDKDSVYLIAAQIEAAELLAYLARYEAFRKKLLKMLVVESAVDVIMATEEHKLVTACFKVLGNMCYNSVDAQKKVLLTGKIEYILEKFIFVSRQSKMQKIFDDGEFIDSNVASQGMNNMVANNDDLMKKLVEANAVETLTTAIKQNLVENPYLVVECCGLLQWLIKIDSGKSRTIQALLPVFTSIDFEFIFDDNIIFNNCREHSQEPDDIDAEDQEYVNKLHQQKLDKLRSLYVDGFISVFELFETLLHSDDHAGKVVYDSNGFEFAHHFIIKCSSYSWADPLLEKLCDICVLVTTSDEAVEAIFKNAVQMKSLEDLLKHDHFVVSSSAALIMGNVARSAEKSEFFVRNGFHTLVFTNIARILNTGGMDSKIVNHLIGNLNSLKNLFVPAKCRQQAVAPENVDQVISSFEKIIAIENRILHVKTYLIMTMITSYNPCGIAHKIVDSRKLMQSIVTNVSLDSVLGVNLEAVRILIAVALQVPNEVLSPELFDDCFFKTIIKYAGDRHTQLLMEFANLCNVLTACQKNDIISIIAKNEVLPVMKNKMIELCSGRNTKTLPLPLLLTTLNTLCLSLVNEDRVLAEMFFNQIKGDDISAFLQNFKNIDVAPARQLVEHLTALLKNFTNP